MLHGSRKGNGMEEKQSNMRQLMEDELENVRGGYIVYAKGKYWAAADDGSTFAPFAFSSLNDAVARARILGWSTELLSKEEYEQKTGTSFNPWGKQI